MTFPSQAFNPDFENKTKMMNQAVIVIIYPILDVEKSCCRC